MNSHKVTLYELIIYDSITFFGYLERVRACSGYRESTVEIYVRDKSEKEKSLHFAYLIHKHNTQTDRQRRNSF